MAGRLARLAVAFGCVVLVRAVAGAAHPSASTFRGSNGRIVYQTPTGLMLVNADGTGATPIPGTSGRDLWNDRPRPDCGHARSRRRLRGLGEDTLHGLGGADTLDGGFGDDVLEGGPGDDRLVGGYDSDVLRGEAGSDRLEARDGARDRVDGGAGSDRARIDPRLDRVCRVELRF